ncbi:MAG: hypothetical protein JWN75_1098 [Candidatus Saccharibacteria bacterium]|nr:hypothetical protein [Candidatus Saccharibacteria bacterium]
MTTTKWEYADEKKIQHVLRSISDLVKDTDKTKLKNYLKTDRRGKKFKVQYTYATNSINDSGRLYGSAGLQSFPREVRKYITAGYYQDIDVQNCMPVLLYHLLKTHGLQSKNLKRYIKDRDGVLQELNIDKKRLMIVLNTDKAPPGDSFFHPIWTTVHQNLLPILKAHPEWEPLFGKVKRVKAHKKMENVDGSFLSQVLQTIENKVLRSITYVLEDNGFDVDTYIFDGCLVHGKDGTVTNAILEKCNARVKADHDISLKVLEKSMDPRIDFSDPVHQPGDFSDVIHSITGYETFDTNRVLCPSQKNMAEWFLSLKGAGVIRHPSGLLFVLTRTNIWMRTTNVNETDLHLQIADVLIKEYSDLIDLVQLSESNTADLVNTLQDNFKRFRRDLELRTFAVQVSYNVRDLCPADELSINKFTDSSHLFAFSDCVYDLLTHKVRPIVPLDYITFHTGYKYPRASNATIRQDIMSFFTDIYGSTQVRDYSLGIIASSLYGDLVNEHLIFHKGNGGNGKGLLMTLKASAFGSYFVQLSKENLTTESSDPAKPNSEMYALWGRRIIVSSETSPKDVFKSEIFKRISGRVIQRYRDLHGKTMSFIVQGACHIQTNEEPKFDKVDNGVVRRVRMLEYPYSFVTTQDCMSHQKKANENLKALFRSDAYRDEFILLLLDHYKERFGRNPPISSYLPVPQSVKEFTDNLIMKSISTAEWFHNNYVLTHNDNDRVLRSSVYDRYKADNPGQLARVKFLGELESIIVARRLKNGYHFCGIRVKTIEDYDKDDKDDKDDDKVLQDPIPETITETIAETGAETITETIAETGADDTIEYEEYEEDDDNDCSSLILSEKDANKAIREAIRDAKLWL